MEDGDQIDAFLEQVSGKFILHCPPLSRTSQLGGRYNTTRWGALASSALPWRIPNLCLFHLYKCCISSFLWLWMGFPSSPETDLTRSVTAGVLWHNAARWLCSDIPSSFPTNMSDEPNPKIQLKITFEGQSKGCKPSSLLKLQTQQARCPTGMNFSTKREKPLVKVFNAFSVSNDPQFHSKPLMRRRNASIWTTVSQVSILLRWFLRWHQMLCDSFWMRSDYALSRPRLKYVFCFHYLGKPNMSLQLDMEDGDEIDALLMQVETMLFAKTYWSEFKPSKAAVHSVPHFHFLVPSYETDAFVSTQHFYEYDRNKQAACQHFSEGPTLHHFMKGHRSTF